MILFVQIKYLNLLFIPSFFWVSDWLSKRMDVVQEVFIPDYFLLWTILFYYSILMSSFPFPLLFSPLFPSLLFSPLSSLFSSYIFFRFSPPLFPFLSSFLTFFPFSPFSFVPPLNIPVYKSSLCKFRKPVFVFKQPPCNMIVKLWNYPQPTP